MDLMEMLTQQLGGGAVRQVSDRVGADSDATSKVISAALPILVGALAKNSANADGASALASALDRDHDGSILDDIGGFLGRTSGGSGQDILKHVLGGRQQGAESALGQMSGLDPSKVGQILKMLAPLVLGALGRQKRESGLSADDLGAMLGRQRRQVEKRAPEAGSLLTQLLDRDGDGSALDDVARMGAGILGSLFGGKR
ncbi:MAG: DUF937 domain-containing protein [Thermoanaerobaculia bacterium]